MTTWSDEMTKRVGEQIKTLRGKLRSAQWLADRTVELGHPVSRTAISEFETNKRKTISVADLTVLAAALGVPPIALIFPDLPDGKVEALPGVEATSIAAAQWFSGDGPNPSGAPVDNQQIAASRRFTQLRDAHQKAVVDAALADLNASSRQFRRAREANMALDRVRSELDAMVEFMRTEGRHWPVDDA